jgi:agmatinase
MENAKIVLRVNPYDGTCSYKPGSRFAPSEIRVHSEGVETFSPLFNKDIEEDVLFYDDFDCEFPFGNREKVLDIIESDAKRYFGKNKILFSIGGEHLVSLPLIKACFEKYGDLTVLHFDAHMDLRENYLGERLSHATVMKRVLDFLPKENFFQLGIRSGTKDEYNFSLSNNFLKDSVSQIKEKIKNKPLYISIDMDVLDPGVFPGTGTPEPGGWQFNRLMEELKQLQGLNIVGADFVELAPNYDTACVSTIVAVKLIREMLVIANG